ncbi:MAG TPA: DUF3089 domain-containing protein [Leptospiraceae bacterium]|nr:DUF3089 domain-containing protein [Leptospiraceae bacterium]
MKHFKYTSATLLILLISCQTLLRPRKDSNASLSLKKPDYSKLELWAAHPDKNDSADEVPEESGLKDNQSNAGVDVFFIHPTTYLHGKLWNADIESESLNERTDKGTIRHQASVFNSSAKVYSPRYRQAVLQSFLEESENAEKAIDFAYQDVKNAFDHYIQKSSRGRPFILAGHSQGARHSSRLLKEVITKDTEILKRLVAAYAIGMPYSEKDADLRACESETDTGCLINWNTYLYGERPSRLKEKFSQSLCINPLTWKRDEESAPSRMNRGSTDNSFKKIYPENTDAKCDGGILWVHKPAQGKYTVLERGKNYHVADYSFFYMNIRENAEKRAEAYLKKYR